MAVDGGGRKHGLHVRIAAVCGRLGRRGGRGVAAAGGAGLLLLLGLVVRMALERIAAEDLEGLMADELAFAVVVGGDHDLGGALGHAAQRREGAGGPRVDHPCKVGRLDHIAEVLEAPAPVRVGEHGLHDVAAQADGDGVIVLVVEVIRPDLLAPAAVLFDRDLAAEDIGDLAGGGILLCDDEPHGPTSVAVTGQPRTMGVNTTARTPVSR
jgi:hypothetical protein